MMQGSGYGGQKSRVINKDVCNKSYFKVKLAYLVGEKQ
jgi:hypothetical protein